MVAVAAGESAKPYKAVPCAIKPRFFRILLFYVLTILTIGLCINYQDATLLTASFSALFPTLFPGVLFNKMLLNIDSDMAASPLNIVFVHAGFGTVAHVVNAVLLATVLSATNSCFDASSRMFMSLAHSGYAPRNFRWVNRQGVPVPALMYTTSLLVFTCNGLVIMFYHEFSAWLLCFHPSCS